MAGRRPLTHDEERALLRAVRRLKPRDRALVTTQWMTGFRVHEVLSLTVGQVQRDGQILPRIGIAPRCLKGGYGRTRWVPVLPELERALRIQLCALRRRFELSATLPLFPSRESPDDGTVQALGRAQAANVIRAAFTAAGIRDDGRLGTHTLRKTWARAVYENGGRDIMLLKAALGHSQVSATQRYLEPEEDRLLAAIARCDFTRGPRARPQPAELSLAPAASLSALGERNAA
jgi:integrase